MKFVDKQLATKLKEKGFDKPCFGYYYLETPTGLTDDKLVLSRYYGRGGTFVDTLKRHDLPYTTSNIVDAPTIEQILKWLREDKDIHIKSDICFRYTSEHKKDKNGTYSGYMDVSKPFWSFLIRKIKNGNCVYDNTTASNNEYFSYEDACIAGIEYVINNLI